MTNSDQSAPDPTQMTFESLEAPAPEATVSNPPPMCPTYGGGCPDCGSNALIRTGSCMTCQNCGSSRGGCS